MCNNLFRILLLGIPLLVTGCADLNPPTIAYPGITTTNITSTSVTVSWNKAEDTQSDTSALVYKIYRSAANPAYQSFDTIEEVEAGNLVDTLTDATTITISSLETGYAYYINIVVLDEEDNKALYDPLGEYLHADQIAYYPFSGNTLDATNTANHLVEANDGVTTFVLPYETLDRFSHASSAYNFHPDLLQCLQSTYPVGISGNANRSVSFWVQSSNTDAVARAPFAWGDGDVAGSNFGVYESGTGTYWTVWLGGTADVSTGRTVTTDWEHWVIGYDSTNDAVYTYKNGVVVTNGTVPTPAANTVDTPLYVGCGMNAGVLGDLYWGNIDDVRIYNQLLSSAAVERLYEYTRP